MYTAWCPHRMNGLYKKEIILNWQQVSSLFWTPDAQFPLQPQDSWTPRSVSLQRCPTRPQDMRLSLHFHSHPRLVHVEACWWCIGVWDYSMYNQYTDHVQAIYISRLSKKIDFHVVQGKLPSCGESPCSTCSSTLQHPQGRHQCKLACLWFADSNQHHPTCWYTYWGRQSSDDKPDWLRCVYIHINIWYCMYIE